MQIIYLTLTQHNTFASHQMKIPKFLNLKSGIHHPQTHLHQKQMTHTHKMKKREVDASNNIISQSPEKRIATNNSQLPLETQNAHTPTNETDV